ncbi:MAG TPA: DUF6152 family protein [Beijerinckiaceae bacterium]|nr:DUF6152 family protein [Beijerinckiaceae bacterium]
MRKLLFGSSLVGAVALAGAALGHHGWGSYDASKTVTITSPVQKLDWTNPHVHLVVLHQGKPWEAVLAPPFRMTARGLAQDMLKVGTPVTLEGYVSTKVENELRAERIRVGGKTFELR